MYIEELKKALAIDDTYTIDNLKKYYGFELGATKKKAVTYPDLPALYEDLLDEDILTPRSLIEEMPGQLTRYNNVSYQYALTSMDLVWSEARYHIEPSGPRRSVGDDPETETICDFVSLCPNEKTSSFYQSAYYLTLMNWLLDKQPQEKFQLYSLAIIADSDPMLEFFEDIYGLAVSDVPEDQKFHIYYLRRYIRSSIFRIISSGKLTDFEFETLRFFIQILLFIRTAEISGDLETAYKSREYYSYLAFYIAEAYLRKKDSNSSLTGLRFAERSLNIYDPATRQDAFNTLGVLAINTGTYLQMAYDAYYSWLNRIVVGELADLPMVEQPFDPAEAEWRKTPAGITQTAVMHGNFAYVCSSIADTYEINSLRRKTFNRIAESEIKKIIPASVNSMNRENYEYYSTYGYVLSSQRFDNNKKNKSALKQFRSYFSGLQQFGQYKNADQTIAVNRSIQTIMRILIQSYMHKKSQLDFDEWRKTAAVSQYWNDLENERKKYDSLEPTAVDEENTYKAEKAKREREKLKKLLDFGHGSDNPAVIRISDILILLRQAALDIQTHLRRLEYSSTDYFTRNTEDDAGINGTRPGENTIASYTTLKNATYLFDLLYQESPDTAPRMKKGESDAECKNCLTVMNANYMNDPYEGLVLLNKIIPDTDNSLLFPDGSCKQFREDIYNNTFVFLKSFTTKVDKLFMWNRYASDYGSDGNNSNGCCIEFDPEMINRIVGYSSSAKTLTPIEDDYYLYRMVYLADNGDLKEESNPGISKNVTKLYCTLKDLMTELNTRLNDLKESTPDIYLSLKEDYMLSLQQTLQSIMFLFKSDDYAEEDESRLIFVRTPDQQDSIRVLPKDSSNLSRLAINPYKQIYIKKITFGPNVRNTEEWKPYLQYQLNKIWEKYAAETKDNSVPSNKRYSIENSKIHYRT